MTTEELTEHQQLQRKHQASERVNNQFKSIQESLLDLSLSDDYERIKGYLATETGGCDLETLLNITGTILMALDRFEQEAQQQLADWVYWAKREQESKNDGKDPSTRAKFAPGAIIYIDPMHQIETIQRTKTTMKESQDKIRERLIGLCEQGIVQVDQWMDRDTPAAQEQLGICWAYLKAGCNFRITSEEECIFLTIFHPTFTTIESGELEELGSTDFYIPTERKIKECKGKDWY